MDILLIGASGFVSGTLAAAALEQGFRVWGVTRGERAIDPRIQPIKADRKDEAAFRAAIEAMDMTWDLVVDVIAYDEAAAAQDVDVFHDKAKRFVFVSTDFVADPAKRTFPQREDNPHYAAGGYGRAKRDAEELLQGKRGDDATRNKAAQLKWTVVRPCHIYGPGSQLGCLPNHSRDVDLIAKLKRGEPLQLVGGGHFLQQPILASDLAAMILSCAGNDASVHGIYQAAGPDIVESRTYYEIIAEHLGVSCTIEETPVDAFLSEFPDRAAFVCHRIYDLSGLDKVGLAKPSTPLVEGLRQQVESLL